MKTTTLVDRFFGGDNEFAEEVDMTLEEYAKFIKFEHLVLYDNGLKGVSGGYATITVYDVDYIYDTEIDKDLEVLLCQVRCGIADETGESVQTWTVEFNREGLNFIGG